MTRSSGRKKRRVFYGNQHRQATQRQSNSRMQRPRPSLAATPEQGQQGSSSCSSAKKLRLEKRILPSDSADDSHYIIINSLVFKQIIDRIGKCPICNNMNVIFKNDLDKKKGFCYALSLQCMDCHWQESFMSSPLADNVENVKQVPYDINLRIVYAFREIGKGYKAISTLMNMPRAMAKTNYAFINERLWNAYKAVADDSVKQAAKELHETLGKETGINEGVANCQVSVDGTWQKRGYSSLNGVVTLLSSKTGKCLDFHVLSKKCRGCEHWSKKTNHPKYDEWKQSHNCQMNHTKSAGSMESTGALLLFQRSVEKHNLQYTQYIGDGDSSSFQVVESAKPYGDEVKIEKLECIGHIQKRVGTRCRELRKALKGTKLSDGKGISGRGRLTDKAINTMQNYYGMAIRQNVGNLHAMRRAVGAVLYHCSDVQIDEQRHQFCPAGEGSWCKWQSDKATNKCQYKKKVNLPLSIKDKLFPIFQDLSSEQLLIKCLHGRTQNANEALNNVIWKKVPKNVFVKRDTIEMGVCSAVVDFNEGMEGICKVAQHLGLKHGKFMVERSMALDAERISASENKLSEKVKKRRKKLRSLRKGYEDKETEVEGGDSYSAGSF